MGFLTPCQGIGACQRPEGAVDESVTFLSILYKKTVIPAEAGMTQKGYSPGRSNAGIWDELRRWTNAKLIPAPFQGAAVYRY